MQLYLRLQRMQQALYYGSAGNWSLYHLVSWQECQFKIFPLLPF